MKDMEILIMEIFTLMTIYEWCRVLLALAQLIAMLGIPFVLHRLEKRERNNEDK
jgi:hypothetical protein